MKNDFENRINREGIYCLKVSGSSYKIGFQHGKAFKDKINDSVIDYFTNYFPKKLPFDKFFGINKPLTKVALKYIDQKSKKFIEKIPKEIKDEIRGLSDATNIEYQTLIQGFVFPEIINYLISKKYSKKLVFDTHLSGAELLGCSSIIAVDEETKTGELLHGRNFDFIGIGYWEKNPLVLYIEPEDGYSYTSITSVGFAGGVVTGMNEQGITYAIHQCYTNEYSEGNLPILALGTLVLKYAGTIQEAEEIIKEHKSTSGWNIVVTDYKSKKAFVAEICGSEVNFRYMEDNSLVCTNSYLSEKFHNKEIVINPLLNISSNSRYKRLEFLAKSYSGKINPDLIAKFLSDRFDITCDEEKVFGYTVSQNSTISSVVFLPEQKKFWVASSYNVPVCNSFYIPFHVDFSENFKLEGEDWLEGQKFKNENKSIIMQKVISAHLELEKGNQKEALKLMKSCLKLTEEPESTIEYICGLLYIKQKEYYLAYDHFKKAYESERDIYKAGLIKLWLGRNLDILGNREKAIKEYKYVIKMDKKIYQDLIKLADKGLRKPYSKRAIKYINIDIWHGEEMTIQ